MKKIGRKTGSTIARKNIHSKQFETLLEYIEKNEKMKDRVKLNFKRAFTLLWFGGFRVSELTNLYNSDIVDIIEEGELHLTNSTKTKTPREVYFSKKGQKAIKKLFKSDLEKEPLNAVALKAWGFCYEKYNPAGLCRSLNQVLAKALGKQFTTHSFRAGYITDMHHSGISLKTIQENIGHSNMATTGEYITVKESAKKKAVKKVR